VVLEVKQPLRITVLRTVTVSKVKRLHLYSGYDSEVTMMCVAVIPQRKQVPGMCCAGNGRGRWPKATALSLFWCQNFTGGNIILASSHSKVVIVKKG
jgi:hypothetical protein